MRIALVNSEYPSISRRDHGGVATYTYCMAQALVSAGHAVVVFVKEGTVCDRLCPAIEVIPYTCKQSRLDRLKKIAGKKGDILWEQGFSRGLSEALEQASIDTPFDIVEIPDYNGLATHIASSIKCPLVIHFHMPAILVDRANGTLTDANRRAWYGQEKSSILRAHAWRSPSIVMQQEATQLFGIHAADIAVIRHPLDTKKFDHITSYTKERDAINILFCGRFEKRKGAALVVASAKKILDLDPRITLTITGEASPGKQTWRDALERCLDAQERKRLYLPGPVHRDTLPALYRNAAIFLFPSLYENAPYALLEAMASHLPVIAALAPGTNEIIVQNETGLLFNPEDPDSMVAAIQMLVENPLLARKLGENGRHYLDEVHKPERIATQTTEFYTQVIRKWKLRDGQA